MTIRPGVASPENTTPPCSSSLLSMPSAQGNTTNNNSSVATSTGTASTAPSTSDPLFQPFSSSSSSSSFATTTTTAAAAAAAVAAVAGAAATGPRRAFTRYPNRHGPTIHIPQPLSPIGLHHVLDLSTTTPSSSGSQLEPSRLPHSYFASSPSTTHTLSKEYYQPQPVYPQQSVELTSQTAIDTLPHPSNIPSSTPIVPPSTVAQHARRIMTPTSRLAETAVSVREVSKKIGRARVKWDTPKTVMIVTKPGDDTLLKITRQIALWMIINRGLKVYVDEKLKDQPRFRYPKFLKDASTEMIDCTQHLNFWTADLCAQEAHLFDFAITLGGDGTVLFTSWLFQRIVPPILPFSAGSLGFLTPFPTTDYQRIIGNSLDQGVRVSLRMRFSCTIYRCLEHRAAEKAKKSKNTKSKTKSSASLARRTNGSTGKGRRSDARSRNPSQGHPNSSDTSEEDDSDGDDSDGQGDFRKRSLPTVLTTPTETFEILNDLVLDRGPSANLSLLELFGDEEHLTTVQADGIVISTPTGSTAYSLAAGGPLTHPDIPAILISPICPHTLSFRPMLLPDSMELRICVPFDSRSTAWASFDGRGRVELKQGDHIKVTASVYPFPTICSSTQSSDWFHSLSRCLRWNERQRQKGFRVVEHSRPRRTRQQSASTVTTPTTATTTSTSLGTQSTRNGAYSSELHAEAFQSADNSSQNDSQMSSGKTPSQRKRQINTERQQQQQGSGITISPSTASSPGSNPLQTNGTSNGAKMRAPRSSQPSPAPPQSGGRKSSRYDLPDDYDPSFQHTETMLTCWGTDYHDSDYEDDDDDNDDYHHDGFRGDEDRADEGDAEWEEGFATSDDSDVEPTPPLVRNRLAATSSAVPSISGTAYPSLPVCAESAANSSLTGYPPSLSAAEPTTSPGQTSTRISSAASSVHPSPSQTSLPAATAIGSNFAMTTVGNTIASSNTSTAALPPKDLEDHLRIPKSTSPVSDGCISFDDDRTAGLPPLAPSHTPLSTSSVAGQEDLHP